MATVRLLTDAELSGDAAAVFADIRATRGNDYVNDFWRALANDPATLRRTWESLKAVMAPGGALEPKVKEMLYLAVSTAFVAMWGRSPGNRRRPGPRGLVGRTR